MSHVIYFGNVWLFVNFLKTILADSDAAMIGLFDADHILIKKDSFTSI